LGRVILGPPFDFESPGLHLGLHSYYQKTIE
jgi:hypothetical protein